MKNKKSTVSSIQNQVLKISVSLNAKRYGITVAVYISKIHNTTFHDRENQLSG